jgi:glycosyltransferase involved in cell wall biosynthesis
VLIVRDEAPVLDGCLASVADVVDEIVVVDTGSVDGTPYIAARYGGRIIPYVWSDDFADARNVGLDAARGEWILYIDADERLRHRGRAAVRALLSGTGEVAFRVLFRPNQVSTLYREHRLWRHDPRIRFRGQIHEKVTPAIALVASADRRSVSDCDLLIEHLGYEGDQAHKHRRNLPLLRAELARDPDNLYNRHHLARVLDGLGHQEEAIKVLADAVELARRRYDPLGVLVFTDLVRSRHRRGDDVAELLAEGRARYPANKLLWWVEATLRLSQRRYAEALALLDRLVAVDLESLPAEGPAYDARIFGEFAHAARGVCLFHLGCYSAAADAYERASQCDPANVEYRAKREVASGRATMSAPAAGAAAGGRAVG